ncbi:hypothetical protein PBY51_021063 [Eleginops maclovinus]|uniref:Secreted protein n=1 Tax=Eleginops maclovinus TaxID=56733 RepID=A0AAN8AE95_ELEMC|nr:hypothetical protein PBY51_021063 [Eleginops maclovinus]
MFLFSPSSFTALSAVLSARVVKAAAAGEEEDEQALVLCVCCEGQLEALRRYALPPRHAVSAAAVAACSVKGEGVLGR